MGYAQIKAAVKTCLYIHYNVSMDHVCMIMHTSSTLNLDIFLYMFTFICIILPHHYHNGYILLYHQWWRPWQQLQHHVTTSSTPSPDKKVIGMFFLYHFHFTDDILGAINNVNDGMALPPLPPPHWHNMFTTTTTTTSMCLPPPPLPAHINMPPMSHGDLLVDFPPTITTTESLGLSMFFWSFYPPCCLPLPPMSLYDSLVGIFGLFTLITHHHHHQWILMTHWWFSPPSPLTTTLTMATNESQWLIDGLGGLRCDASWAPGIF